MAKKTVTESEYEIMKILWESDAPITVGEVYKRLPEAEKRWSKNTVATLLVRLCEKGAAAYEKKGSCHLYYATLDRADYSVSETKSFVSRGVRTYSWTPKGVEINVHQRRERASTKRI